jgi:hypothetical protein
MIVPTDSAYADLLKVQAQCGTEETGSAHLDRQLSWSHDRLESLRVEELDSIINGRQIGHQSSTPAPWSSPQRLKRCWRGLQSSPHFLYSTPEQTATVNGWMRDPRSHELGRWGPGGHGSFGRQLSHRCCLVNSNRIPPWCLASASKENMSLLLPLPVDIHSSSQFVRSKEPMDPGSLDSLFSLSKSQPSECRVCPDLQKAFFQMHKIWRLQRKRSLSPAGSAPSGVARQYGHGFTLGFLLQNIRAQQDRFILC